ncbi:MAG: hypothetical protein GY717_12650, partial [Rhodobacteraceae bacterium]|nr:hypothetical protein [Paracoccaceae bacterium]
MARVDGGVQLRVDDRNALYPLTIDPILISEVVKLTAGTDAAVGDYFGRSVAISGDTLVVGAPYNDDPSDSGSAYVFARNSDGAGGVSADTWGQVSKLTASDADIGDQFGFSVAISGDTLVVGARFGDSDTPAVDDSGSAYVFE